MKGKNILSPTGEFEFSGNFSLSFEPADYHFTMEFLNTDGNVPFFQVGEVIPAIFKREGNKIWAQWGSFMFGIPRPACMDSPVMFVKQ